MWRRGGGRGVGGGLFNLTTAHYDNTTRASPPTPGRRKAAHSQAGGGRGEFFDASPTKLMCPGRNRHTIVGTQQYTHTHTHTSPDVSAFVTAAITVEARRSSITLGHTGCTHPASIGKKALNGVTNSRQRQHQHRQASVNYLKLASNSSHAYSRHAHPSPLLTAGAEARGDQRDTTHSRTMRDETQRSCWWR
ncbi:uncharacterized protein LOC123507012 [Portunus trituberculatus]|uniref:uncharacterized protein LOC123507012 n=1 Tax=Portunus trituberculatus TaxID=210409 RepID=UPI001E1D0350|nr:uncharacterized protein LOC123507012 [Portunus trituberculatus]